MRLGDVCTKIGSGATPRGGESSYHDSGIPLIRSQNVHNDGFREDGLAFIGAEQARELNNVEVKAGDILLNITGDSIARTCVAPPHIAPARVNQHVAIIRPSQAALNPRFLHYWLISRQTQELLLQMASAGATRKVLTKAMIEDLTPPDLPKSDQDAIAATLGAIDEKIEANRHANRNLEDLARAFFAHLFPHDPEDDLPPGWHATRVSDVAAINARTLGKTDELSSIEYIEISEVNRGRIGNTALHDRGTEPSRARRRLSHGDTVMSTVRPERGSYFLCLDPKPNLIASTGFTVISPRTVPWSYLYLALTHPEVFDCLERLAVGAAYPAVHPDRIGEWPIAIPSDGSTMQRFHDLAGPLLQQVAANERESRTLAALRDTLLPKLLSGEIRIPHAEKEVARHA
jgi:type I restriction enzyme S subunit